MPFDCQPITQVQEFIKKNYKGGTVLDFGCGCGRYADCFPADKYTGVDGHEGNVSNAKGFYPDHTFLLHDLNKWKPAKKFDYLFSSVVFDQVIKVPKGLARTYILIEPAKYEKEFKLKVNEPLESDHNIRLMVGEEV